MNNSIKHAITFSLFFMLHFSESNGDVNERTETSRAHSKMFGKRSNGGLISFDSEKEKLRIDWAVTIPFISIPLEHKAEENGEIPPLLHVNTKGLGIVGLIATLFSFVTPLFSRPHQQFNYRAEDNGQWLQMGNTINEMLFDNDYVVPCIQYVVCSAVSVATKTKNPTSTDKLIDGLSSHKWFNDVANGTIIQDAVANGRKGNHDCARIYNCSVTTKLLNAMMNEFGIA